MLTMSDFNIFDASYTILFFWWYKVSRLFEEFNEGCEKMVTFKSKRCKEPVFFIVFLPNLLIFSQSRPQLCPLVPFMNRLLSIFGQYLFISYETNPDLFIILKVPYCSLKLHILKRDHCCYLNQQCKTNDLLSWTVFPWFLFFIFIHLNFRRLILWPILLLLTFSEWKLSSNKMIFLSTIWYKQPSWK